ncbi:thymidine phosphorylase [Candidatus Dojkabacteria bacterium]|uniref:Thymidine phosphorylase n=1 Tax=Candidatus Dojkabacteria bacterium TaxID=2099670 RepID=A0A955KVK6_9BACT|nr:thymidine phosphorylase [Candidatus Dojkabacteria bacterium]MCB9790619.1 thymidine phosphorylase [Candidatus Nomurabacteria bacterium]
MALYLQSKKFDGETGDSMSIMLNGVDADKVGINKGDKVLLFWRDLSLYVDVIITDTETQPGSVGIFEDIWSKYQLPSGETVTVDLFDRPKSIEFIKDKLLGKKLTEDELAVITSDISSRKIRETEIAYFMATFFNPGFDDEEILWTIKGMANAGEILDFRNIRDNGNMVVDKHSIGGVAAKGITPLLVPIVASFDLVIPNTSTRAITTPAGTTDILEVVMPVTLTSQKVMEVVKEVGACMIWGGALKLSPADDVLINVERGLHIQSFQKMLVSIVAKKVSMGITHIIIDIPYGPGTKVEKPDDVVELEKGFKKLFHKVGIECEVFSRHVTAPDGMGIGPSLEVRDILWVFERDEKRPIKLEKTVVEMAGKLLEMTGRVDPGKGRTAAMEKLESGEAYEKFWEIAMAQGAKKRIDSSSIEVGEYVSTFKANKSGTIKFVDNKEIVNVARGLGNPFIKEAGVYLYKTSGDRVEKGEPLMEIYASSQERLGTGTDAVDIDQIFRL